MVKNIDDLNKAFQELSHMGVISIESNAFGVQVLVDNTEDFLDWAFENNYNIEETDRLIVKFEGLKVTNFYRESVA